MKVSVSLLERFRHWRDGDYAAEDEDYAGQLEQRDYDFIVATLRGETVWDTEQALMQSAFRLICADPDSYYHGGYYERDGFQFDAMSSAAVMFTLPQDRTNLVHLDLDLSPVTIAGTVGYLYGNTAGDVGLNPLTASDRRSDHDRHAESIEWKAYLLMIDGRRFTYHATVPSLNNFGRVSMSECKPFRFYRTDDTDNFVRELVGDFYCFAQPFTQEVA